MSRALVLMKAMPPTRGHQRLIEFAQKFSPKGVVFMDYAPGEPLVYERKQWLFDNVYNGRGWYESSMELNDQDPKSDGFWERWTERVTKRFGEFDYVIGSESYCAELARRIGARYIPYDPGRELYDSHATRVREEPMTQFASIAPDFQQYLRTTVTVWGAESTGKTTLSKQLADVLDGYWTFEWARPYLEGTGQTVVDTEAMHEIWHGQYAIEHQAKYVEDKAFLVRDTDLYSTIGYWEQPHWEKDLGTVPSELIRDARYHRADLYIITQSNIPFEKDPLRYGGDHRESPDEYWISVADKYNLPYVVLTETDRSARLEEAVRATVKAGYEKTKPIRYSRKLTVPV